MRRAAGPGRPVRLPAFAPGMRIGLYGGSFDPPHAGHRHVALTAMRRLGLDRVWWIVTPRNLLKQQGPQASRDRRLAAARALARHPRMEATDIDATLGAAYTIETVRFLRRRCPGVRLVWIMGADSLAGLHRWRSWREILHLVPVAVVDRPGWTLRAASGPAARAFSRFRVPARDARRLADRVPPAWIVLHAPRSTLSSTALRKTQGVASARVEKAADTTFISRRRP